MSLDVKNVENPFYFTRKDWIFEVLNKVFISNCEHNFLHKMFLVILGAVGLQINHGIAF